MMRYWLISDTHFHHLGAMVTACGRPSDHTERTISNILRLVNADDVLVHLGDVALCKGPRLIETLARLSHLRMWLILGNHDHQSVTWYLTHGFAAVCQSMVFRNVLLTHAPANVLPANATLNVHGHLHNTGHHPTDLKPWHKLFALENERYEPVLWDKWVGAESVIQL